MTAEPGASDQEYNRAIFSSKAADYAGSRPGYPAGLFDELFLRGVLWPAADVADVGAGTGLLTRGLLERGCRVVAVEPNAAMRAEADSALNGWAGYRSVPGSAEETTLASSSLDLVTAAQAFHWFDPDRAPREFLRILRPAGRVALIWNERLASDPLHRALEEVFVEFGGTRRNEVLAHEDRGQVPRFFGGAPTETLQLPHEHRLDRRGLQRLVTSRSYMPARDTPDGARAVKRVGLIFESLAAGDHVTVRYQTVAVVGRPAVTRHPIST